MTLRIDHLTKTYPNGVTAMNDLSLEIGKGMFGLLGPNGAGKSTLMRTIATLQSPDKGSLFFGDIDVLRDPLSLRRTLGYLPQSFGLYPKTSAEALLHYFAALKGIASGKDRKTVVEKVLELTNLYEVRKKRVSGFSGGMKQRFGIAQLLLNNPKLLIVDEPTAGLDPAERNRFLNVIRSVAADSTVLFSTHIVDDVKDLCTDMAIMHRGRILQRLAPSEASNRLAGKVWTKSIEPSELPQYEARFQVLSSGYNETHRLTIRVLSEVKPDESFASAAPTLEDAYFSSMQAINA